MLRIISTNWLQIPELQRRDRDTVEYGSDGQNGLEVRLEAVQD